MVKIDGQRVSKYWVLDGANITLLAEMGKKGYTPESLADATDTCTATVYNMLRGRPPTDEHAGKIASILEVGTDYLFPKRKNSRDIMDRAQRRISLKEDTYLSEEDGVIKDADRCITIDQFLEVLKKCVRIGALSYSEREALKLRYGLSRGEDRGAEYTFEEISKVLKITREGAKQIVFRGEQKLRSILASRYRAYTGMGEPEKFEVPESVESRESVNREFERAIKRRYGDCESGILKLAGETGIDVDDIEGYVNLELAVPKKQREAIAEKLGADHRKLFPRKVQLAISRRNSRATKKFEEKYVVVDDETLIWLENLGTVDSHAA